MQNSYIMASKNVNSCCAAIASRCVRARCPKCWHLCSTACAWYSNCRGTTNNSWIRTNIHATVCATGMRLFVVNNNDHRQAFTGQITITAAADRSDCSRRPHTHTHTHWQMAASWACAVYAWISTTTLINVTFFQKPWLFASGEFVHAHTARMRMHAYAIQVMWFVQINGHCFLLEYLMCPHWRHRPFVHLVDGDGLARHWNVSKLCTHFNSATSTDTAMQGRTPMRTLYVPSVAGLIGNGMLGYQANGSKNVVRCSQWQCGCCATHAPHRVPTWSHLFRHPSAYPFHESASAIISLWLICRRRRAQAIYNSACVYI